MKVATTAKDLWSVLHGVVCVHKPRDVSISALKRILVTSLCEDANAAIEQKPLPVIEMPIVERHPKSGASIVVGMRKQFDYSAHPLVVGEPFLKEDIRVEELQYLEPASSGVCLFGINDGCDELESIRDRAWVNEYRLKGQLGRETVGNEIRGKITRRCGFEEVTHYRMQKLLRRVQAQYKRLSFELANVDVQSQEAFELARKGLPRAKILGTPIIYHIELTSFKAPYFALRLHCVSETDSFLRDFIREIAVSLGSTASCRRLLCTRLGPFDSEHSLLDKHFTLKNILTNMRLCKGILERDKESTEEKVVRSAPRVQIADVLKDELVEILEDDEPEEIRDCLRIPWGRDYKMI